jgi:hypothetical protein
MQAASTTVTAGSRLLASATTAALTVLLGRRAVPAVGALLHKLGRHAVCMAALGANVTAVGPSLTQHQRVAARYPNIPGIVAAPVPVATDSRQKSTAVRSPRVLGR